jgi:hypothetical protein
VLCSYISSISSREQSKEILQRDFAMDIGRRWIFEKTNVVHMCNIAEYGILFLL